MIKKILCIVFVVITVFLFTVSASALSGTSYSDLPSTSSQVNNLINYAMSYDDFINSDYVCYRDEANSYYLVWSDEMTLSNSKVTAEDIKYVRYYRPSNTSTWQYYYGEDDTFSLTSAYLVTSNIKGFGTVSELFETYYYQRNLTILFIVITAFVLVIAFVSLKGGKK